MNSSDDDRILDASPAPLVRAEGGAVANLDAIADDLHHAESLAERSRAQNTREAYRSAWRWFELYCEAHGASTLPAHPATVAAFLAARSTGTAPVPPVAPGTRRPSPGGAVGLSALVTAAAAIRDAHARRGLASPTDHPQVRRVLDGLTRDLGRAAKGKLPVRIEDLIALRGLHDGDTSPRWLRDWSILLVGFASALRRSNLAALGVDDVTFDPRGLAIWVARSKTDQEGAGRWVGVLRRPLLCPVRALEAWRAVAPATPPLWCGLTRVGRPTGAPIVGATVEAIVKNRMAELGFDPAGYGAHSLRAGFATAAKGRALRDVMSQGGWSDPRTALRYQRKEAIFDDNPSDVLP